MVRNLFLGALVSLAISNTASAMGWHCTDNSNSYWKFHADSGLFSGDVLVTNPVITSTFGVGLVGNYGGLQMNTSWSMVVGGTPYYCLTADHAQGKIYNCTSNTGSAPIGLNPVVTLFNCEGGLFD